ncbi:prostatic acid phosphatase-like isoform X3 [Cotesia glomerata]|nr:prostatic acid phosphatase-like isoform X3 [Cotesia glomerata]
MMQLYELGDWIRSEYDQIIGAKYDSSSAFIRSSYADRCIMSAQALLAALYRPEPGDNFIENLPWRPVPVHSIPRDFDKLITVKYRCPKLEYALKEAYVNESIKTGKQIASYFNELSYYTGKKISTITDVEFLYNTLEIEANHGLELPEWTKKFYNEEMRRIAARSLALFTSNTLQQRLRGGPLLKEITNNMMSARNGHDKIKLYLYSAHDITLVNVLRAMGFTNELFKPDYGAALIFELVLSEYVEENNLELNVKVKYLNNTEIYEPTTLEIPHCKEPCKLVDLLRVWKDVLPVDWDSDLRCWIIDFWSCFIKRFKSLLTDNPAGVSTTNSKIKSQEKLIEFNPCLRRRKRKKLKNYQAKIVNKYQETVVTISHRSDTDFSKLAKDKLIMKKDSEFIDKIPRIKSSEKKLENKSESLFNLEKRKYSNCDTVEVKWLPGPFFDRSQSESNFSMRNFEDLKKINEINKLNKLIKKRRGSKIPRLKKNEKACLKCSN